MNLSAKEAADQVGLTKAGIIKAIKTGKVSAQKDQNGEWKIEPVELFRVYAPVGSSIQQPETTSLRQDMAENTEDTASLHVEIRLLRERLADKDDQIDDLRQRLDAEAEERRRLSMLLTDTTVSKKPKSIWQRFLGH